MNYRLVCGVATLPLALAGCLNDNPFYLDPTGDTSSTSEDPTTTVGESSTDAATTEEVTSSTGSTGDTTTGGSSSTGLSTGSATSDTDESTGDDTGGSSSTTMPVGFCGDGTKDPGELCDDGNLDDTDMCTVLCIPPPKLKLENVLFPELTGTVGTKGQDSNPGLCPNAMVGMGISGNFEVGILRAKLACQDFNIVAAGDGEFEVQRLGVESYGPYSGNMGAADLVKGVICPDEAPFLRGLNGWFGEPEMTKIEVQCSKLRIVPFDDSYIVVPDEAEIIAHGYDDWGDKGEAITCDDYPGSIAIDVIIHSTENGVTGLQLVCAEPSFD